MTQTTTKTTAVQQPPQHDMTVTERTNRTEKYSDFFGEIIEKAEKKVQKAQEILKDELSYSLRGQTLENGVIANRVTIGITSELASAEVMKAFGINLPEAVNYCIKEAIKEDKKELVGLIQIAGATKFKKLTKEAFGFKSEILSGQKIINGLNNHSEILSEKIKPVNKMGEKA